MFSSGALGLEDLGVFALPHCAAGNHGPPEQTRVARGGLGRLRGNGSVADPMGGVEPRIEPSVDWLCVKQCVSGPFSTWGAVAVT